MPKIKTRRSVATRFRVTKTGKVLRRVQTMRHLRRRKSKKQLRRYKVPLEVKGKLARKIKRMLGK